MMWVVLYVLMAGVMMGIFHTANRYKSVYDRDLESDLIMGLFWPVTLPLFLAMGIMYLVAQVVIWVGVVVAAIISVFLDEPHE